MRPGHLESWERLPPNLRGAVWLLLSGVCFAVMGASIKALGNTIPSVELVFFRSVLLLCLTLPVLLRAGFAGLRTARPKLMLLRALMAVVAVNCTFYAFTVLPLADVVAISFTRALFITVLAVIVLRELVGVHRWTATVAGFAGVLLVVQLGAGGIAPAALFALLAAAMVAGLSITVRLLSSTESNAAMMTYPALLLVLVTSVPTALHWVPPTLEQWPVVGVMAGFGVAGQWCIIQGYRVGEASALSPIS